MSNSTQVDKGNGVIFYDGPSLIDGSPIVGIALAGSSSNRKTGELVQTYILRSDMHPQDAIKSGKDSAICGSCPHKETEGDNGRTCYVFPMSFGQVYKSYKKGAYDTVNSHNIKRFKNRKIRFGSYGDPLAIPWLNWTPLLEVGGQGYTSYTHQWKDKLTKIPFNDWKGVTMASVESVKKKTEANALGFKTYRVGKTGDKVLRDEMLCPASEEAGKVLKCSDCMRCNGATKNVFIPVHGPKHAVNKFNQ